MRRFIRRGHPRRDHVRFVEAQQRRSCAKRRSPDTGLPFVSTMRPAIDARGDSGTTSPAWSEVDDVTASVPANPAS
jgi:hypothetical protein